MTQLSTLPRSGAPALRAGLPVALVSAIAYGLSGPVGKSLLDAGWSPTSVALTRIGGAALVLAIPTLLALLRAGSAARTWSMSLLGYGVIAIAGVQLCFFTAIGYMPVSSVLLIEYSAPVLLIFWTWARTRRTPAPGVLLGAAIAVSGLAVVIGVGAGGSTSFHPIGALWAFGAAVCLTAYFAMAAGGSESTPPALVLTGGGMLVGSAVVGVVGLTGIMPLHAEFSTVVFGGRPVSFLLPALILCLVCATVAYLTGIAAVRIMGAGPASLFSLSEVVFAFTAAWLLLGETPEFRQLVGGAIILAGIVVTSLDVRALARVERSARARRIVAGLWQVMDDRMRPAGRVLAQRTVRGVRAGQRQLRQLPNRPPSSYPTVTIFAPRQQRSTTTRR